MAGLYGCSQNCNNHRLRKISLPHDTTQLKIWSHNAAAISVLSEMIPKLNEATSLDGPKGIHNTTLMNHNYNTIYISFYRPSVYSFFSGGWVEGQFVD